MIQNIVSLSRVAPSLGFEGEPLVAGNTGKDRVKNWEPVAAGGAAKRVEDLEAGEWHWWANFAVFFVQFSFPLAKELLLSASRS